MPMSAGVGGGGKYKIKFVILRAYELGRRTDIRNLLSKHRCETSKNTPPYPYHHPQIGSPRIPTPSHKSRGRIKTQSKSHYRSWKNREQNSEIWWGGGGPSNPQGGLGWWVGELESYITSGCVNSSHAELIKRGKRKNVKIVYSSVCERRRQPASP